MTKLEDSDVYVRTLKTSWVEPILVGSVKPEDESKYLFSLVKKAACDKEGNDIEDLDLDDFMKVQKYITSKMNPEKKS